jgi:hypothetical protein
MTTETETVFGACIECRQVGEMKRRNGFLAHNKLGTDIECEHSGLELKGYGALSGDPVSEYLAKFAEEENAGRVSYHGSPSEQKALGVWSDIADALGDEYSSEQVRACVVAIAKAIDDERERCAKVIDQKIIALMKDIAILMKHGGHEIIDQIENSIMPNLEELAAAIRSRETDNG